MMTYQMKKLLLSGIAVLFLATGIVQSQSSSDVMNTIAFTAFAVIAVLLWPKTIAYREHEGDSLAGDLLFTLLWGGLLPGAVILGFWVTR
jgi:RsiW-degrading membrane proteinase PrsW (M82 family)